MSGFGKNLIPRRIHKERSQPAGRIQKHGLLEKRQDYKLRAKDRNRKKLRVKLLREKAAFRNPDEFYYGMIGMNGQGGRVRRGVNRDEQDAIPIANRTRDERLLAETQDARYVTVKHGLENGKLESLKKGLHFLEEADKAKRTHTIFVEDEGEMDELAERKSKEAALRAEEEEGDGKAGNRRVKALRRLRDKAYKEYSRRAERKEKLGTVLGDMNTEKMLLAKGRRFKVRSSDAKTGAPAVFKWQQERSR